MSDWFPMLFSQTWQVAILAILVWIAVRVCAQDRPHLAHALWLVVLIKCLTPPVFSSPASPFSWIVDSQRGDANGWVSNLPNKQHGRSLKSNESTIDVRVREPAGGSVMAREPTRRFNGPLQVVRSGTSPIPWWKSIGVGCWLVGAGLGSLILVFRYARFLLMLRNSKSVEDPRLIQLVEELTLQLGIRRPVRVLLLDKPIGPAVLGLWRPTVLLPASLLAGKSYSALTPLIAHELVHIRRGDLGWALIQSLSLSLFWFHPFVWMATRSVTRESERSCDEETIASLQCRPADYARSLLDVLEQKNRLYVAPALPGVRPVDITTARLERIMRQGQGSHQRTPVWIWSVVLLIAALVLPGAAWVTAQETEKQLLPPIGKDLADPPDSKTVPPVGEALDWKAETFDVGQLVLAIGKQGLERQTAEQKLISYLPCRKPGDAGEYSTPQGRSVEIATEQGAVVLGRTEPTIKIINDQLYIFDQKDRIESVRKLLESFSEHGLKRVTLDVVLVSTTVEQLNKLGVGWSIADSTTTRANSPQIQTRRAKIERIPTTIDVPESSVKSEGKQAPPLAGQLAEIQAASFVEKSSPVLHSFVESKLLEDLIRVAKSDERTDVMTAPRVVVQSGKEATINSLSQRPFVVGYQTLEGDSAVAVQPVVKIIEEGFRINVKPTIIQGDNIALQCDLSQTEIRSVSSAKIVVSVDHDPVEIQIPEMATIQIRTALDVPKNKSLVLNLLREDGSGEMKPLLVFLSTLSESIPVENN
jgi:beta-lactamase regulating signal transducer with metallopeptidase domain